MPSIYEFGSTGLKAVEPTVYINNPRQYKFAALKDRIISNFTVNFNVHHIPQPMRDNLIVVS